MTMVAACYFSEGATIIADSRVTWQGADNAKVYGDRAQKILCLGPRSAIAFAGSVALAESVVSELRTSIKRKPSIRNPWKLSQKLSRVARFQYAKYVGDQIDTRHGVHLVLGSVTNSGAILLWKYTPPDFSATTVREWVVIGSGAVVAPYLEKNLQRIETEQDTLKDKANRLMIGLESELEKHGLLDVGGLFQAVLLTSKGICPLTYGFFDLRPEEPGNAKEITMSRGIWTQKDLTRKENVVLVEPTVILKSRPKSQRFHDYGCPRPSERELRWYLNHFITCLNKSKELNSTRFKGVFSQIGSYFYPMAMPVVVSLEFWGPRGTYPLRICQDDSGDKVAIHEEDVRVDYPYDHVELERSLRLYVQKTGPIFLDCYVENHLLGRKALFFGKPDTAPPNSAEEMFAVRETISKVLADQHRKCSDPALKGQPCFLDHFIICTEATYEESEFVFSGEVRALYSKKYPLLLKLTIVSGFRLSEGRHNARIDLVNAFTHERATIASHTVEPNWDCIVVPVMGEILIRIPEPAIYYFNLYVDDQFVSSVLLPAETDTPKFSYSLLDDQLEAVRSGQLLILAKRSKQVSQDQPAE
jgi:20S proteasome alpha/beta subunit